MTAASPVEVSVVVPGRNVADVIDGQLDALARQVTDRSFEVVVVDDASTDETSEVARGWEDRLRLQVVRRTGRGFVGGARNDGVAVASGEKFLFVDADDVVADDYVEQMAAALDHDPVVAARVDVDRLNPPWARSQRDLPQAQGLQSWGDAPFRHAGGGTLGVTRAAWEVVGPFTTRRELRYAEAADWCFRAQAAGQGLAFAGDAVLHVRLRDELAGAYRQARGWAECAVAIEQEYAGHGVPAADWRRGLLSWALVPVRLLGVRDRAGLARWLHGLGWRMGRLRGSWANRRLAF